MELMGQTQSCLGNYFVMDSWQAMLSVSERPLYCIQQQHYDPEGCHRALMCQDSQELPITPFSSLTLSLFPEQLGSTHWTSLLCFEPLLGGKLKISSFSLLSPLAAFVCAPVCVSLYQESVAAV